MCWAERDRIPATSGGSSATLNPTDRMANPPHVQIENFRVDTPNGGITLPRFRLRDRRAAGNPLLFWVLQRQLEQVLYGRAADGGSSGAIWKVLNHTGLGSAALGVNGAAVYMGQVTQEEYNAVVSAFKTTTEGLDPCSKGRIRSCTLLPVSVAAAVCRTFGRTPSSIAFLRVFNQAVPEAWEQQEQAAADEAAGEVDLVLQEQLESGQSLELEEVGSFAEELQQMAPFAADSTEEGKMKAYALSAPPSLLLSELRQYVAARTAVFDARRAGGAVVSTTVEGDTQGVLRFFGYLHRTHSVPQGAWLYVSKFMVRPDLGDLVEGYALWLRQNQQIRYGSIANYLNQLAAVTAWAYRTFEIPADTAAMDPSPLAQIYNLRGQAEGQSKTEQMFDKRVGGWMDWGEVQRARCRAIELSCTGRGSISLARDAAAVSMLSLIPPDRVGLIRKLRLGHTLKKAEGGGWRLDLSKQRDGHKTSKFYGPFAARLPSELDPVLDKYAAMLELGGLDGKEAYLFYPVTGKPDRAMESSAWTAYVRKLFGKLSGTEIAPKTLRSIFITWLRETTDCPEVLKSAAHAMKHQQATQESGHYDANADTKLVKAAYEFNLKFAAGFKAGMGGSDAPPGPSGSGAGAAGSFKPINPMPEGFLFQLAPAGEQPTSADSPHRVFRCDIDWHASFSPGCSLRFDAVPGLSDGITFTLPDRDDIAGKKVRVQLRIDKQGVGVSESTFTMHNLLLWTVGETEGEGEGAPPPPQLPQPQPPPPPLPLPPPPPVSYAASHMRPPIVGSDLCAQLKGVGFARSTAAKNGDCFPLSAMAGFEITATAAKSSRAAATRAIVRGVRKGAVDILATSKPTVHGVDASVFRASELLPEDAAAAHAAMSPWLELGFWQLENDPHKSASFQLGVSLHLERQVAVIERSGGKYTDPARIYGARDHNGALVHSDARPCAPETIPTFTLVPMEELVEMLRANPRCCSLVEFDRMNHFVPWIFKPGLLPQEGAGLGGTVADGAGEVVERAPSIAATEVAANGGPNNDSDTNQEMPMAGDPTEQVEEPAALRRSGRPSKMPRLSFPPHPSNQPITSASFDRNISNADAFDVSGVAVGDLLMAKGFAPSGQKEWFCAQVTALRAPPSFPPIVVKFIATEDGSEMALALPRPNSAYVIKADTKPMAQ